MNIKAARFYTLPLKYVLVEFLNLAEKRISRSLTFTTFALGLNSQFEVQLSMVKKKLFTFFETIRIEGKVQRHI